LHFAVSLTALDFPAFPALATALSNFLVIGFELIDQTFDVPARSRRGKTRQTIGAGDMRQHAVKMVGGGALFNKLSHIKSL
jgi:hypothetical protein